MPNIDVPQMKMALSTIKERLQKRKANPKDYFAQTEDAFRRGIEVRRNAVDLLAGIPTPYTPTIVRILAPFLIWALRDGEEATSILSDSGIVPSGSWARIFSVVDIGSDFFLFDQLSFYFFWQNDTGNDAIVNVSTYLMLNGLCEAFAHAGWIWSPLWGQGTIGSSNLSVDAELTLLEWWNQPPTEPLRQPGQLQNVVTISANGGWALYSSGDNKQTYVSNNYHLNYDTFLVPSHGAAVFEVSLNLSYQGYDGGSVDDFKTDNNLILCPYVELQVVTAPTAPERNQESAP